MSRHQHCPQSFPWLWLRSVIRASLLPGTLATGSCSSRAGPPCAPCPWEGCPEHRASDCQEWRTLLRHTGRQVPAQARPVRQVRRGQQDTSEPVPVGKVRPQPKGEVLVLLSSEEPYPELPQWLRSSAEILLAEVCWADRLVTRQGSRGTRPVMSRSSMPYNAQCSAECRINVHCCSLPQQPKESCCCPYNPKSC